MAAGAIVLREFAGVDLSKSPRDLADVQLAWCNNAYGSSKGVIESIPGIRLLDAQFFADTYVDEMVLIPWRDRLGKDHTLLWVNFGTNAAIYDLNLTSAAPITSPFIGNLVPGQRPAWAVWQQKLYLFTGTKQPGYLIDVADDGSLSPGIVYPDVGAAWDEKVRPTVAAIHNGSMLLAGFEPPNESVIRWLDNEDPSVMMPETNRVVVGANDGDRIVGAATVSITGGSMYVEPYTFVFKRRSTWAINGIAPQNTKVGITTVPATSGNIVVTPINMREGCVAKETIVNSPHGLLWCSGRNVWLAPRGGMPVEVGNQIAPYLAKKAQEDRGGWSAAYHNGFYKLSIPSDLWRYSASSSVTSTEDWWLDLREYPDRIAWWGPHQIPSGAMAVSTDRNGVETLVRVFCTASVAPVVSPGTDLQVFEDGVEGGFSLTGAFDESSEGPGFEAKVNIRFKEYDFGDPMLDKLFQAMELHMHSDSLSLVAVEMYGNGGAIRKTPSGVAIGGAGSNLLGTMALGSSAGDATPLLAEEYQSVAVYPPGAERLIAKTFQPVLKSPLVSGSTAIKTKLAGLAMRMRVLGRRPA